MDIKNVSFMGRIDDAVCWRSVGDVYQVGLCMREGGCACLSELARCSAAQHDVPRAVLD
ncbi:MAG: hypothetical protein IJ599_01490 [Alphaproteobacteria bacterium]|nr:hypothetical protein [Alphaproteobacteria bacterium]